MRVNFKAALIAVVAGLSFPVFAGQFACSSYGNAGCTDEVKDIVTEKFTAKYPVAKYEIVVVYDFQKYSDGGGVGFAMAGVAPKVTETQKYGDLSLMPLSRYITTQRITSTDVNPYQATKYNISNMRRAVQLLMEACDRDAKCDVMLLK